MLVFPPVKCALEIEQVRLCGCMWVNKYVWGGGHVGMVLSGVVKCVGLVSKRGGGLHVGTMLKLPHSTEPSHVVSRGAVFASLTQAVVVRVVVCPVSVSIYCTCVLLLTLTPHVPLSPTPCRAEQTAQHLAAEAEERLGSHGGLQLEPGPQPEPRPQPDPGPQPGPRPWLGSQRHA